MTPNLLLSDVGFYSLQIGLVVLAGILFAMVVPLRSAGARFLYWQALLAGCLLLPAVQPWRHPVMLVSASITAGPITSAAPASHAAGFVLPVSSWILVLLAAGALVRTVWLGLGFIRIIRHQRGARPLWPVSTAVEEIESRLRSRVPLAISDHIDSPVTFGLLSPVILLPARFTALGPQAQAAIVCHELTHVRRRDWAFVLVEELIRCVLWFHPAIWWLLGQIQMAREQVVDREVIRLTSDRDEYLEALLAVAAGDMRADLAPAPLFLKRRHLSQRVAAVLKEIPMSKRRLIPSLLVLFGLVAGTARVAVWLFPLSAPAQVTQKGATDNPAIDTGSYRLVRGGMQYPAEALAKKIQGTVWLQLTINPDGGVTDARVISGPEELRRAALKSALEWQFSRDPAPPPTIQVSIHFDPSQFGVSGGIPRGVIGGVAGHVPAGVGTGVGTGVGMGPPIEFLPGKIQTTLFKQVDVTALPAELQGRVQRIVTLRDGDILDTAAYGQIVQAMQRVDSRLMVNASRDPQDGKTTLRFFLLNVPPASVPVPLPPGTTRPPHLLHKVEPIFPEEARQAKIEGTVVLKVTISSDGTVRDASIVSGPLMLLQAAIDAVNQWQFEPARTNGQPVDAQAQIEVNFRLI